MNNVGDLVVKNCRLPLSRRPMPPLNDVIVSRGRIVAVTKAGRETCAASMPVLDAHGGSVLPGFVDCHIHVPESGVELLRCDMSLCRSRDELTRVVRDYADGHADEEWIVGRGWGDEWFVGAPQTLREIDAMTGSRPAYLNNRHGHSAWVNSAALAVAGIDERTGNPPGGTIVRDAAGRLTGLLLENAMQLVSDVMPAIGGADLERGLMAAQQRLFSLGVTAWQDANVGPFVPTTDNFDVYRRADADGSLKAKVTGSLWWPRTYDRSTLATLVEERRLTEGNRRFRCTSVKIMYDGSLSTQSAALSVPYVHGRPDNLGETFFAADEMTEFVRELDQAGFDLHFHAIGDRAIHECVDAVRNAVDSGAVRDRRHQLAHLWLAADADMEAMARLGIIANIQPLWAMNDSEQQSTIGPCLPEHLRVRQLRFGSLARRGVRLALGSDWPVSSPDPLGYVHTAVNRARREWGVTRPFFPDERLTLGEALAAATAGGAYAMRREDEIGAVDVGKAADLVVLDGDVTTVDPAAIDSVGVVSTVVDGEVVYRRES